MKSWIAAFIFIGLSCCEAYSQNKNKFGLDFQLEYQTNSVVDWKYATNKTYQASTISSFGIVYERLLSQNSGIEFEIKYQSSPNEYTFYVPGGSNLTVQVNVSGRESFLSIPILFRYNTNILNVSLGPTFEYFLSWEQTKSNYLPFEESSLPKYFFPDKLSMGLLFKISKSIHIGDQWILDPGIFYNPILSYKNNYFGLSVIIKYPF
jgi:hypothetical protein